MAAVFPDEPHQLCHFHDLREAAKPIYEADRHAKKALKKQVRGIRPIERSLEGQTDEEAQAMRDYCLAVRSALTADGRPPLGRVSNCMIVSARSAPRLIGSLKKGASQTT